MTNIVSDNAPTHAYVVWLIASTFPVCHAGVQIKRLAYLSCVPWKWAPFEILTVTWEDNQHYRSNRCILTGYMQSHALLHKTVTWEDN